MYPREFILEHHDAMRAHKEHMWYEHHENDPPPHLAVRWRDMQIQSVNFGALLFGLFAVAQNKPAKQQARLTRTDAVLWGVLKMLSTGERYPPEVEPPPKRDTPIESVWFTIEGYQRIATEGETRQTFRGDLEREYRTNPDSGVYEVMQTYMVETGPLGTAEWARTTSGVHKGDGGRLVWDEPEIVTSDDTESPILQDGILEIMTKFVTRENLT